MNDQRIKKLEWLANEVVEKILEKDNFTVFTLDLADSRNIMHHVISSCDRAQLVVADITENDPFVLYEIGVIDALGKACVPVIIRDDGEKEKILPPFDRALYRCFRINAYKTNEAIKKLEPVIHRVLKAQEAGNLLENPLTDYFGVPLYTFSAAHGLAKSYFRNLVLPCSEGKIVNGPEFAKGKTDIKMECVIPNNLDETTRHKFETMVNEKIFIPVTIKAVGRDVKTCIWSKEFGSADCPVIVDIPTTLGLLRDNVIARLGRNVDPNPESDDFQEIQSDEISQFKRHLQKFVNSGKSDQEWLNNNFKIMDVEKTQAWLINNFKIMDIENTPLAKMNKRNEK